MGWKNSLKKQKQKQTKTKKNKTKQNKRLFVSMEYVQPILSSMVTTAGEQSAVPHLSNPIYLAQNFVSVVSLKGFLKLSTFPN